MVDSELTFFGWSQPPGAGLVTSSTVTDGRLTASVELTVEDVDEPSDFTKRPIEYDLFGPGDVRGFTRAAVTGTVPSRGARNVEIDKAVHVALATPDLPWRYTLDRPSGRRLRPWIVLLVGTEDEIEVADTTATVQSSVLDAHPLVGSERFAHVELDGSGVTTSRLTSSRPLAPNRKHVAVVVPAYTASGGDSYPTPSTGPAELPVYFHWTFHTKTGGDFASFARKLRLVQPAATLGNAEVTYGPLPQAGTTPVRGALMPASVGTSAAPVPPETRADLRMLTGHLGTPARPILGLPDLTSAWPSPTVAQNPGDWRDAVLDDFSVRAIAGLGQLTGVTHQELLAGEAGKAAGAHEEVSDRLRRLTLGLLASRSLWRRRMPTDDVAKLSVVGPAVRGVLTERGPVAHEMEHPQRAFEGGLLSSAALRALRVRPESAPTAGSTATTPAFEPERVMRASAVAPTPPPRSLDGSLHTDAIAGSLHTTALDDVFTKRPPSPTKLRSTFIAATKAFEKGRPGGRPLDPDTKRFIANRLKTVGTNIRAGKDIPILPLLELLDNKKALSRERHRVLAGRLDAPGDSDDLAELASLVSQAPSALAPSALPIDHVATTIIEVFDPTVESPAIAKRVLDGLVDAAGGLTTAPDAPVELLPDLPLAAWRFLRDDASEWLLPGVDDIEENRIVGLTTNPAFVDTFLLGLNAQVISELRFRNYPIIPGWSPVRTFWDRSNAGTAGTDDDIDPIDSWPDASKFGDASHLTPAAASADLVVLFHSGLFREYPGTVVSLVPVARDSSGAPDWTDEPIFDDRIFPAFEGQITPDMTFFGFDLDPSLALERWVVLDETVTDRRFFNSLHSSTNANNGASYAAATFSPPRRVMIRGDILLKEL